MYTTPSLITFLQLREGFRKHAYDDAQPHVKLTAETEIEGTITIGYGTTSYPDGTPVAWHDTVSKSEAVDYLQHYIRETIEPAIEQIIHVPLAGCQYDAIGSCIYQYGRAEVEDWNLVKLINNPGSTWQEIAREWINGTVMWLGEPLFWGRRIQELFMFLGIDWRAGANVPALSDPIDAAEAMGFDGTLPKPAPIVDEDLFKEFEIPTRGASEMEREKGSDPTPETPITMDDAQFLSAEAAGYEGSYADFMSHRTVVTTRNAIEAPKIDVKKPPKPMEDSKTHRGLAKKTAGKEGRDAGAILAGAGSVAGAMNSLSKNTAQTVENTSPLVAGFTFNHIIILAMVFGFSMLVYGAWRMYRGEMIAREGREDGTQLKV